MTKKKAQITLIALISIAVLLIISIICVFLFKKDTVTTKSAHQIITESIQTTFEPIKVGQNALISDVLETSTVSVSSINHIDDNTVSAQCVIKSKDAYNSIKTIAENYGDQVMNAPKLLELYRAELEKTGFIEHNVEITLIKTEETWTVDYTYEVLNALMGGYLQYNYEAFEQLISED